MQWPTFRCCNAFINKNNTYLQNESPLGDDTHVPPFLQGLGEHEIKPGTQSKF